MPFMTRIPSDLARFGLKVELVPGWETRGSSSFAPASVVAHWTAGPRGTTKRPSLNVCTYGRTDLPGPLCNIYLARDGTCVVVAAGRSNHAGTGGWRGLVGNSAAYGIEAESAGDGDWTPAMLDAYPRLIAALLRGLGRDANWMCGHHEWAPGRKIDIRDVIGRVRADTARHLAAGSARPAPVIPEEDMPLTDKDYDAIAERVWRRPLPENHGIPILHLLSIAAGTNALLGRPGVDVDEAALAAQLGPLLAAQIAALPKADAAAIGEAVANAVARRMAT